MGNHIACIQQLPSSRSPDHTIKLIRTDGHVKIYHRPIPVSELLLQFPKHLICHSDSFFIGQKIPPLSDTDYLELGNNYFLLPSHFFQSVLSFVTIASIASSAIPSKKTDFVKNIKTCRPFDIHKTASGTLQIRVSDEFVAKLVEEGKTGGEDGDGEGESTAAASKPKGRVCTTPELEKDYSRLVGFRRSREWKPKLETIREKKEKKEKKAKRKLSAFVMERKKKGSQKSEKAAKPPPPPPPPPPPLPRKEKSKGKEKSKAKQKPPPPPPPPTPPPPPKQRSSKQQAPPQQKQQTSKKNKGKEKKGL